MSNPTIHHDDDRITVIHGDVLESLKLLPDNSIDSVVTDPPYGLEFMGKDWDSPSKMAMHNPTMTGGPAGGLRWGPGANDEGYRNVKRALPQFQAWCTVWATECLRVLKPGGYALVFGGTRTWHRMCCAVEDAGFEIRDSIAWLYGSGFPKSLDVSKAIDKAARGVPQGGSDPTSKHHGKYRTQRTEGKRWQGDSGQSYGAGGSRFLTDGMEDGSVTDRVASGAAENVVDAARQWQGWGTALKPAHEPIIVARKPLIGTVAKSVLEHGTGALNIDACRIAANGDKLGGGANKSETNETRHEGYNRPWRDDPEAQAAKAARSLENTAKAEELGRWPTNVVIDESQAQVLDEQTKPTKSSGGKGDQSGKLAQNVYGDYAGTTKGANAGGLGDEGGVSRYFPTFKYQAKASKKERPTTDGVAHPTVKPLELMRWLVKLVTQPGGMVLEPFAGSGTTGEAALLEGMNCIMIEREAEYLPLIMQRIERQAVDSE